MAALALKEGSLYFLRDKDYLNGEVGRYVKIGIVREDKSTEQRMQQHQTGNPRGMLNAATLKEVPFVEKLETRLHYRFNEKWITGEWFELSEPEAQEALEAGKAWLARHEASVSILAALDEVEETVPEPLEASSEMKRVQRELIALRQDGGSLGA